MPFSKTEWKKDKDWQRVLTRWHTAGKTGMTVQQIAYLCGRDAWKIYEEMCADPHIRIQLCKALRAPVFGWFRFKTGEGHTWSPYRWGFSQRMLLEKADLLAKELLEKYPSPKYKGIANWKGTTKGNYKLHPLTVTKLKATAAGKQSSLGGN